MKITAVNALRVIAPCTPFLAVVGLISSLGVAWLTFAAISLFPLSFFALKLKAKFSLRLALLGANLLSFLAIGALFLFFGKSLV